MNSLTIIGNLTADPELRSTPAGVSVCNFTVAVNSRQKDKDGNTVTTFFRVAALRGLGDNCAKYLTKGKKVAVSGEVSARVYDGKDGKPRAQLEINASDVEFLSPRTEEPAFRDDRTRSIEAEQRARAKRFSEIEDAEFEIAEGDLSF